MHINFGNRFNFFYSIIFFLANGMVVFLFVAVKIKENKPKITSKTNNLHVSVACNTAICQSVHIQLMNNTRANANTSDCFIRIHIECMTKHTESLCYVHSRYLIQYYFGFFSCLRLLWIHFGLQFNHIFTHKRSDFRFICAQISMFIIYFVTNESFDRSNIFSTKTLHCLFAANVKLFGAIFESIVSRIFDLPSNFLYWWMHVFSFDKWNFFFWIFCNITSF